MMGIIKIITETDSITSFNLSSNVTGNVLPKFLFRPFYVIAGKKLNSNMHIRVADMDMHEKYGFYTLLSYFISAFFLLILLISDIHDLFMFYSMCFFLLLGIIFGVKYNRTPVTKFIIFNRAKGIVQHPKSIWNFKMYSGKWENWGARIIFKPSGGGYPSYQLLLVYKPNKIAWPLYTDDSNSEGIDRILGYWSFLVQYMDPSGVLPNVPEFENYPNRINGIASKEEWEQIRKQKNFIDPYEHWLEILEYNPKLDEFKYESNLEWEEIKKKWSKRFNL